MVTAVMMMMMNGLHGTTIDIVKVGHGRGSRDVCKHYGILRSGMRLSMG
jgi:hypothetical protein